MDERENEVEREREEGKCSRKRENKAWVKKRESIMNNIDVRGRMRHK